MTKTISLKKRYEDEIKAAMKEKDDLKEYINFYIEKRVSKIRYS